MAETFMPYGLHPDSEYFLEQLTGHLCADGHIPESNMTLAQEWCEKARREHVLGQKFPGRRVTVRWFDESKFSDRTRIKYVDRDPSTPAEILVCDGETDYEPPMGGPDPGEYNGSVDIRGATFCVHWMPEGGDVTALLSVHCAPETLDQHIRAVL